MPYILRDIELLPYETTDNGNDGEDPDSAPGETSVHVEEDQKWTDANST